MPPASDHVRLLAWLLLPFAVSIPRTASAQELPLRQVLFDRQARPERVVVSADDLHAYAVSPARDAIAVLERDGSGVFGVVQYLFDDRDGVDGLKEPSSVAISPDGKHVYVGSGGSEGIAIFARNAATGHLTFVENDFTDAWVSGLTFFGDGYLHVTGPVRVTALVGYLAVFTRDSLTGGLTLVDIESDGAGGVDGIGGAEGVAVTPDGVHVYVTGSSDDAVAIFARAGDGTVSFIDALFDGIDADNLAGAVSVATSPDGLFIYVAGLFDDAITAFSRDSASGLLTVIDEEIDDIGGVAGMRQPQQVLVPSDGTQLYTVSAVDNSLVQFDRDAATGVLDFASVTFEGGANDGLRGARGVTSTPSASQLLTAGRTESEIGVFDHTAGIPPVWNHVAAMLDGAAEGLENPRQSVLSNDQTSAYVVANTSSLAHFDRAPATGELTYIDRLIDGVGGVDGIRAPQSVVISDDDAFVYTASWPDDSVSIFSRDAGTGTLSYVASVVDGVGGVSGIEGAWSVALSPGSSRLYVAGRFSNSVALFDRAPGTGDLTFVDFYQDGVGGIVDLQSPYWIGLSADGENLYAVSLEGIVVFTINSLTGELSFLESHPNFSLPDFVNGLSLSPDGLNAYAVLDEFILGFTRNAATGSLTLSQTLSSASVPGLESGFASAVRPDGLRFYVGASETLIALARDPTNGALAFLERVVDSPTGTEAVDLLSGLTLSGDSLYLYALDALDHAVSTFSTSSLFQDGFETGDTSAWSASVP